VQREFYASVENFIAKHTVEHTTALLVTKEPLGGGQVERGAQRRGTIGSIFSVTSCCGTVQPSRAGRTSFLGYVGLSTLIDDFRLGGRNSSTRPCMQTFVWGDATPPLGHACFRLGGRNSSTRPCMLSFGGTQLLHSAMHAGMHASVCSQRGDCDHVTRVALSASHRPLFTCTDVLYQRARQL
jgi:hypothetical protein